MIDTLRLILTDYTISKHTKLLVQPSIYDHSDGMKLSNYDLFVDESTGEVVTGMKAYYNGEKINLTIKPSYSIKSDKVDKEVKLKRKSYDVVFRVKENEQAWNSPAYVQISVPRYKNPSNFYSLKTKDELKIIEQLGEDLKNIGIKTNIFNSNISRLDTFTNLETDEKFYQYKNIFDIINLSRKKAIDWNGSTFLWKNNQSQITVYDKIEEMNFKLKDKFERQKYPANVMRIENRNLTKKKILNNLGVVNVDQIFLAYDELKKNHKETINKNIFRYEPKDLEVIQGESLAGELMRFYRSGNRFWFQKFLTANGLKRLLTITSIDTIKKIIDEMEINGSESRKRVIR
ncbi:MAG TPA: hypothetical protein ENO18_01910, partial [Caldithrix sp.]|nr:hypothetical protein [Caldithrix sp.]